MKIIVGLGNPGEKYIDTRHNAGFLYMDFLSKKIEEVEKERVIWEEKSRFKSSIAECTLKGEKLTLIKPQTFMNDSGVAISQYLAWTKEDKEGLLVVHDDLDIPLGAFKMNTQKSPKVHNGIISIEEYLHTKEFERLRIGIDSRKAGENIPGIKYVLGKFTLEELELLHQAFEATLPELLRKISKIKLT